MKTCTSCKSEMFRLETENPTIKTYACTKCGLIENYFEKGPLEALMKVAKRVDDEG